MAKFWNCVLLVWGMLHFTYSSTTVRDDSGPSIPMSLLQQLFDRVSEGQIQEDLPAQPGQQFVPRKGTYDSEFKFNGVGHCAETVLRQEVGLPDANAFFALMVSANLLEAYKYGDAPKLSETQLKATMDYVGLAIDKKKSFTTSIIGFWPMMFMEKTQRYQIVPTYYNDLINALRHLLPQDQKDEELSDMQVVRTATGKIGNVLKTVGLQNYIELLSKFFEVNHPSHVNNIVADFDDTFYWIGIASLIETMSNEFSAARAQWISYNPNITSVFDTLKKYAYRPFSKDPVVNTIDARSYFAQRGFLDAAAAKGEDVVLPTTWATNKIDHPKEFPEGKTFPFVNDVCGVVSANVVYGITASVLSGLLHPHVLDDPGVSQIYHNTTAMLAYQIRTNLTNHQHVVLTYYTSRYLFYNQVARSLHIMENYRSQSQFPVGVMESAFDSLKDALEGEMTRYLLSVAQIDDDGNVFYDDYLGNGDLTPDNKTLVRGEDRIFTSGVVANALMYTWLVFDKKSKKSQWKEHTPEAVKETVACTVKWLTRNALSGKYKPWNSAFTTGNKGTDNLGQWYPANSYTKPDGTPVASFDNVKLPDIEIAMQGYVPQDQYEALLKKTYFGRSTPRDFRGYNDPGWSNLVFWSSEPFTFSHCLLALSRYKSIES